MVQLVFRIEYLQAGIVVVCILGLVFITQASSFISGTDRTEQEVELPDSQKIEFSTTAQAPQVINLTGFEKFSEGPWIGLRGANLPGSLWATFQLDVFEGPEKIWSGQVIQKQQTSWAVLDGFTWYGDGQALSGKPTSVTITILNRSACGGDPAFLTFTEPGDSSEFLDPESYIFPLCCGSSVIFIILNIIWLFTVPVKHRERTKRVELLLKFMGGKKA